MYICIIIFTKHKHKFDKHLYNIDRNEQTAHLIYQCKIGETKHSVANKESDVYLNFTHKVT